MLALFAHQGGWDEVLLVALPMAFIGILLFIANRRVNQRLSEQGERYDAESASEAPEASP